MTEPLTIAVNSAVCLIVAISMRVSDLVDIKRHPAKYFSPGGDYFFKFRFKNCPLLSFTALTSILKPVGEKISLATGARSNSPGRVLGRTSAGVFCDKDLVRWQIEPAYELPFQDGLPVYFPLLLAPAPGYKGAPHKRG